MVRVWRFAIAFGTGWWLAAAVATLGIGLAALVDPTTDIPVTEWVLVPVAAAVVPGAVPVVAAWWGGLDSGLITLPAECGGSTAGACHGIGWGIAAQSVIVGIALLAVAWVALPVGLYLDTRGDEARPSRRSLLVAAIPYVAATAGLSSLARRERADGRDERRARAWALARAVGAYLAIAATVFLVTLAIAAVPL